ncbi:MAG: hypothetical protein GY868_10530 [Deltaproteobacteria bacterium]|nr:hypothetical protein [Deltaproteobacteria bacterium]
MRAGIKSIRAVPEGSRKARMQQTGKSAHDNLLDYASGKGYMNVKRPPSLKLRLDR